MPAAEQFPFWRDVVWQAFVPVSLARADEGLFPSTVSAWTVGPVGISRISSRPQRVTRTEREIARRRGDVFFLNMPLTPGTSATQSGRTAALDPGDLVLVDAARPFELLFEHEFEQVSLTIPHDLLAPLLASPLDATAVRIRGDAGVGGVASAAIRELGRGPEPLEDHTGRALADHLAGLVALAAGRAHEPARSHSRAGLLQAALDEIERSLGEPELTPAVVAGRIGISVRYLHQLFTDHGPSFGRWLLIRRLERCHRDLGDPARRHWTVAAVAHQHGFRDPSYFARAFKARFAVTPRAARARLLEVESGGTATPIHQKCESP